ncbi:MAG: hypothetical protein FWG64_11055 [Firmicutes bacterium]|nr:hypothetical protein [Bacillota bacterium]
MKNKNKIFTLLFSLFLISIVAACATESPAVTAPQGNAAETAVEPVANPQLRDGLDDNLRFTEPRTISVALWDRSHDRIPNFNESYWAEWVQSQILEDHNIIVEWVPVPRWEEAEFQSTLLSAGSAPDIGYTFNMGMLTTFSQMGGMQDLAPLMRNYGDLLPHLYTLLGNNIYWNLDPLTGELFSIAGRLIIDGRNNMFVREDWLDALDLEIPRTVDEFEEMLVAFRDNAELLLGDDAANIIPYQVAAEIGWTIDPILSANIPNDLSEREWFRYGFDIRRFTVPGIQEGVRTINRWYHMGLLWDDFTVYDINQTMASDLIRLGYVGAFAGNWDFPFRAQDALITTMRENQGEQANFIAIPPLRNDAGVSVNRMPNPVDRFIFFPTTNNEPLASLLYLDWISRPEVIEFLAFGIEGVHRQTHADGAIEVLGETDTHSWPDHQFIPSLRNFDIAITINGISLGDPVLDARTLAFGYPGIAPEAIMYSRAAGLDFAYFPRNVVTRIRPTEEGMSVPLADQREIILAQLISQATPETFDSMWATLFQQYLNLGAQAIIDDRDAAWVEAFGDVDTMPD